MTVTLDASVWLASLSAAEIEHEPCRRLIAALVERGTPIHQPGLFIIEVCATIARRTGNRALALKAGRIALDMPHLTVHALHHRLAAEAADIAATCALRGADAIYVATARDTNCSLITLDRELLARAGNVARVRTPSQWIDTDS